MSIPNTRAIAGLALLLLFTWWCYAPGLNSLFLYDDFPNLQTLAVIAPEPVFSSSFWQFVASGEAGPLGRPVSLFTFALQADAWPASPFSFKVVNCLLHLFNGVWVYLLCRQLTRPLKLTDSASLVFGFCVTALWLLHPSHVATVLFSVQRMTLLASTFMLMALCCHLHWRLKTTAITEGKRVVWLSCSLALFGIAGLLAKEMAAVLLCYLLALEYTLLLTQPVSRLLRYWRYLFLWLPLVLLVVLASLQWSTLQQDYAESRDFTMQQKVLTEARVLWMYLSTLVAPFSSKLSLFQLPTVSTSLWQPLTTLLALACWLALLVLAVWRRRQNPVVAFAVLWYLGGHLIESTLLPLSLMFNHRNYLPYLGPLLAFGYGLGQWRWNAQPVALPVKAALCLVFTLFFALQLQSQSRLWADPLELASTWYLANPRDSRNKEFLAIQLAERGAEQATTVADLYDQMVDDNPGSYRFLLNRLLVSCRFPSVAMPDSQYVMSQLQRSPRYDNDLIGPLKQLVSLAADKSCPTLDVALLDQIAERGAAANTPKTAGLIAFERGRLALIANASAEAGIAAAMPWFQRAFDLTRDPAVLFTQAQYLLETDKVAALKLIDQAESMLFEYNDISSGTRMSKLTALATFRAYATQDEENEDGK